jgi:FHA domain-containing protein
MALILEVMDARTHEVRTRVSLGVLPLAVGRGLDNDLVLDDPYVDGHHARIGRDETGALVLEDLGSKNGLITAAAPGQSRRVMLLTGTEVRVGRTTLRFRDPAEPVPPSLPDYRGQSLTAWWGARGLTSRRGQAGITAAATAAVGMYTWLENYDRETAGDVFAGAVAFLLVASVWAGIWAAVGRIVVHRFRFAEHLAVVSAVVLTVLVFGVTGEWVAFFFPDNVLAVPIEAAIGLGLIAALVAGHLALASSMTPRRCWRGGLATCGVVLVLGGIGALVERKSFSDVPEFSGVLKPVRARWIPAGAVKGLERAAADLKDQVDALATKK